MWKRLHIEYPLFTSDFNKSLIFSTDFRKKTPVSSFIEIRPVGAELFHADRRTDIAKLIVAFRNYANAPKKDYVHPRPGREGPEGEQRYISTLSLTSALDGGRW